MSRPRRRFWRSSWLPSSATAPAQAQTSQRTVDVYAAGSLRAAFEDLARAFEKEHALKVKPTFGASGLLKDRIVAGESPQVFASANMEHPEALVAAGRAPSVSAFARNALCVLATPSFSLQGKSLALRLLDADVRVGTSTPKADPSGDYAFTLFERIESSGAAGPGSAAALKAKALQLTGGPGSPAPPPGRNVYGELVAGGQADAFVTYCTNATAARREHPHCRCWPCRRPSTSRPAMAWRCSSRRAPMRKPTRSSCWGRRDRRSSQCTDSARREAGPRRRLSAASGGRSATRARPASATAPPPAAEIP